MPLIPQANLDYYQKRATPQRWAFWSGLLAEHGTAEAGGIGIPRGKFAGVAAAIATGTYDPAMTWPDDPPPAIPATPARSQPSQGAKSPATLVDRRTGGRGCHGCGGQSAVNATGSPEAINAVLTE